MHSSTHPIKLTKEQQAIANNQGMSLLPIDIIKNNSVGIMSHSSRKHSIGAHSLMEGKEQTSKKQVAFAGSKKSKLSEHKRSDFSTSKDNSNILYVSRRIYLGRLLAFFL